MNIMFRAVAGAALTFGAAGAASAAIAVIPDVGTFAIYGIGDATVTYDAVVFTQQAAIDPNSTLYNVSPAYAGAALPVLSSQGGATGNILITLPNAVTTVSFGYDTFNGSTVSFLLSNGDSFALGSFANGYALGSTFAANTATPFTTILVTSTDQVLNIGSVTYGTVPEPTTWALMLAGFAVVGAGMRRRVALAA